MTPEMKTIAVFLVVNIASPLAGASAAWWVIRHVIKPAQDRCEDWMCRKFHVPNLRKNKS